LQKPSFPSPTENYPSVHSSSVVANVRGPKSEIGPACSFASEAVQVTGIRKVVQQGHALWSTGESNRSARAEPKSRTARARRLRSIPRAHSRARVKPAERLQANARDYAEDPRNGRVVRANVDDGRYWRFRSHRISDEFLGIVRRIFRASANNLAGARSYWCRLSAAQLE
jgi:hypothetical protein